MPSTASDIRVRTTLARHPKWLRLRKLLGNDGRVGLLHLWIFAREHRPDGSLAGLEDDEIEAGASWDGEPGALVRALEACGWLDRTPDGPVLHGWGEHQPWAVSQERRSEIARANASKRWDARYAGGTANGKQAASDPHDTRKNQPPDAIGNADGSMMAMLPSPPLPSPPKEGGRGRKMTSAASLAPPGLAASVTDAGRTSRPVCADCGSSSVSGSLHGRSLCLPCSRKTLFGETHAQPTTPP